ncbi:MAG: class I SAM-dependent methyltransferase [Chloroflexaceae bacterium]|nr:class I SAM-dependent methyltransferase [Chloroflexaceae bacterium]
MHFAMYYRWLVYYHLFGPVEPDATILDIGCYDGGLARCTGVMPTVALDPQFDALRRADAHIRICADGTRMPLRMHQFDYVLLSDVIEHVPADRTLITEAAARVAPGGTLLLSTTAQNFRLFPSLQRPSLSGAGAMFARATHRTACVP